MKLRRSLIFILVEVLLATTLNSACFPNPTPPILNPPNFIEVQENAYFGIEANQGSVELDNALSWHFENEYPKDIVYYAFRVTLSTEREGTYEFSWVKSTPGSGATGIPKIDGPCPVEANREALRIMRSESLKFTGNSDGPAIFSGELAQRMALGLRMVYWETCDPELLPEARDDKDNYLKNFTFLVNVNEVPGTLRTRLLGDESNQRSAFNNISMVHSPFHMAVIGDSVMWGEGLNEEDKLWVQVSDQIAEETDQIVRSRNFAHSGAVVGEGSTNCTRNEDIDGEILRPSPNIHCQLDKISADGVVEGEAMPLERLDMLLMDGCINDVSPTDIALGMEEAGEASTLTRIIRTNCDGRMSKLLTRVRKEAPNARVILIGYFPILSTGSIASCPAQIAIGAISFSGATVVAFALSVSGGGGLFAPNAFVNTALGITVMSEAALAHFLNGAEQRSQQWVIESDELLDNAAIRINEEFSGLGVGSITFVSVSSEFEGHEAFTNDPWLWNVDCVLNPEDPVASTRIADCAEFYEDDPNTRFFCERGSTFHPNVTGEATYVRLVIDKLRALSVLPEEQ